MYIGAKNVASESVKQELVFVGSEAGKLIAIRDIIRKVVLHACTQHMVFSPFLNQCNDVVSLCMLNYLLVKKQFCITHFCSAIFLFVAPFYCMFLPDRFTANMVYF